MIPTAQKNRSISHLPAVANTSRSTSSTCQTLKSNSVAVIIYHPCGRSYPECRDPGKPRRLLEILAGRNAGRHQFDFQGFHDGSKDHGLAVRRIVRGSQSRASASSTCESREPGQAQTGPPTLRIANVTCVGHPLPLLMASLTASKAGEACAKVMARGRPTSVPASRRSGQNDRNRVSVATHRSECRSAGLSWWLAGFFTVHLL